MIIMLKKVLLYFRDKDHFLDFKKSDLKKYDLFKNILISFRNYYGLNEYNLKDIDRYLWQLGKDYFKKKY